MPRRSRPLAAFLPALALLACGKDASIPLAELGPRLLDVICTRGVLCQQYPDRATCAAVTSVDLGQLQADVNAGKTRYDGAAAARCLDAVRATAGASCSFNGQASGLSDPSCDQIVKGTGADGSACFSPEECVSASCDTTACAGALCCAGTCDATVAGPVPIGGDCTARAARCVAGAYCSYLSNGSAQAGRCAALIASGQPCGLTNGDLCEPGTFCLGTPGNGQGVCGRAPAQGEACDQTPCDFSTDFCDSNTVKCAPRIALGGACPSGTGCVAFATCSSGTCVVRPAAGGACDDTIGLSCLGSLACTAGLCVVRPASAVCP